MNKFHVYHISFYDSLIRGLKANGVALNKLAQQSYIKRFDLENPGTYLPLEVSYEFTAKVKRTQGIDCISSEFYGGFQMEELKDYGVFISSLPDLKSILENAIKYEPLIQTSSRGELKTDGPLTWFSVPHLDAPSEGRQVSERINLSMMLEVMQLVLGKDWVPLEIHVTSEDGYWLENLVPSGNFKLKTNCPAVAICFKTTELSAKNKHYSNQRSLNKDSVESIEHIASNIINSLNGNYIPTMEEFSDYFGYSKSSLIRTFAAANTSYKKIVEKQRFNRAIQMLQKEQLSVDQIAAELGYSTTSNFIRAFKRWTAYTPQQYRTVQ